MNKKCMMASFIQIVNNRGLMTKFIKNIFGYDNLNDYNYIFRLIEEDNEIIIDIYDNVSNNRFNRYIFSFIDCNYDMRVVQDGFLFVKYICILNVCDSDDNLVKFAYLFKIDNSKMLEYLNTFLDSEFVDILMDVIK